MSRPNSVCAFIILLFGCLQSLNAAGPSLRLETGGHTANCVWLDFTPDGRELITLGADKVIRVWDVTIASRPRLDRSLRVQIGEGQAGILLGGAISPLGDVLAVCGQFERNVFLLLDPKTGKVFASVSGHEGTVRSLAFSPDGRYLLSGGDGATIGLSDMDAWRASGKQQLPTTTLAGHTKGLFDCSFLPTESGLKVISTSNDQTLRIWKYNGAQWVTEKSLSHSESLYYQTAVAPNGRYFAVSAFNQPVRLFSSSGRLLQSYGKLSFEDPQGILPAIGFSPDSRKLIYGLSGEFGLGGGGVFDIQSGRIDSRFGEHNNTVQTIAAHPFYDQGNPLIASSGGDANEVYLWNGETGKKVGEVIGRGAAVYGIALSQDGRQLAFGQKNGHILTVNADHPLTRTFDFNSFYLGEPASESWTPWQRRFETANGWSAKTSEDLYGSIELFHQGQLVSRIQNETGGRVICYSFLPNGRGIIVGYDFGLAMYDTQTGRLIKEFIGHESTIWSVAVSQDGRTLYSSSGDQTFRAWDLKATPDRTGGISSLLNFFVTSDGQEWIAWTNEGYYTGSPGADEFIGWHINRGIEHQADFASAWQYAKAFRRPEIVSRVLEARSTTEAIRLVASEQNRYEAPKLDVAKNQDELAVPQVTISAPDSGATTEAKTIRVTGFAQPSGTLPIKEIRVLVNGRPASGTRGFVVQPKTNESNSNTKPFDVEVGLLDGENRIEVIATTEYATSQPAQVKITRKAPITIRPTLYVLGIGVAQYQQSDLNLEYPDDDVTQLIQVMQNQSGGLYKDVVTNSLIDDQVTDRNIRRALVELQRNVTQHDVAIVILSGHGDMADGQYFYCPHDHDPSETAIYGIRFSDLTKPLTQMPCKVLLCLDTCHAAGVLGPQGERTKATTSAVNRAVSELTSIESGMVVMASSTGQQSSIENDDWGHGAFALALIEALSGQRNGNVPSQLNLPCDLNGDDILELTEIDAYVTARVKELTGGRQQPVTERGRIPSFPIATVK